ncbi:hypothetical protein EON81_15245 [bacterium]|nr:MAG: hypothetical protein EON81_15245 [bacterium]
MNSGSLKLIAILFGVVVLGVVAVKLLTAIVSAVIALAVPVLIIGVVAYVLYASLSRKALGAGRRRILP